MTSARATATRCCWPPDSSVGSWSSRSPRPSRSSAAVARRDPLASGRRPGTAAASRRCRARSSAAAGCTTGRRSRWSGCGAAARPSSSSVRDRRAGQRVGAGRRAGRGSRGCSSSCSCRSRTARRSRRTRPACTSRLDVVERGHRHPAHVVDAADPRRRDDRRVHVSQFPGRNWRPATAAAREAAAADDDATARRAEPAVRGAVVLGAGPRWCRSPRPCPRSGRS